MAVTELGTLAQLVHDSFVDLPNVAEVEVKEFGPELRVWIYLSSFDNETRARVSDVKYRLYNEYSNQDFDFTVVDDSPITDSELSTRIPGQDGAEQVIFTRAVAGRACAAYVGTRNRILLSRALRKRLLRQVSPVLRRP